MSFRRSFLADLRRQCAAETESPPVSRLRLAAAVLSMVWGIVGVVSLLPVARGVVSWGVLPGSALLAAGGVFGLAAHRGDDVVAARRRGAQAALCTAAGLVAVSVVLALTQ